MIHLTRVEIGGGEPFPIFAARFQAAAACLAADERLLVTCHSLRLLKSLLADTGAHKIHTLRWKYGGLGDVDTVIPRITARCPELVALRVDFDRSSTLDFASQVLERPENRVAVLEIPSYSEGDAVRFFAALERSPVTSLAIFCKGDREFNNGLMSYLQKDMLVRLKLMMRGEDVPSSLMTVLGNCTHLSELKITGGHFYRPATLSGFLKSITKLVLVESWFHHSDFDWSFLEDCNLQELVFRYVECVDTAFFGRTLAVHLRTKGLDRLCLRLSQFAKDALVAIGPDIRHVRRLDIFEHLNDRMVKYISDAFQHPDCALVELFLVYGGDMGRSIDRHLVPALKHPNCRLTKLQFHSFGYVNPAAVNIKKQFDVGHALFALLHGRRRRGLCLLQRLPVEMFRMMGKMLL